jgi:hypothetical protein
MAILTLISFLGTKGNQHFGHRSAVVEDSHIQRGQAIIADAINHTKTSKQPLVVLTYCCRAEQN